MIEIISTWAKNLGVTIVLVSIIEMILPNNKTKKYIRMILGIFVIFNIISPFINNKENISLAITEEEIKDYYNDYSNEYNNKIDKNKTKEELNQTSMNKRIQILYQDELEKDIITTLKEEGYEAEKCKVEAQIYADEENNKEKNRLTGITKIKINIKSKEEENINEDAQITNKNENNQLENKLVNEIQKIKKVEIGNKEGKDDENNMQKEIGEEEENKNITKNDIKKIKKILIEKYEVTEECLEIN